MASINLIHFIHLLLAGMYKQHVNKSNPLGTGGVLVQSLADLIRVMWSGNYNFISPVTFRVSRVFELSKLFWKYHYQNFFYQLCIFTYYSKHLFDSHLNLQVQNSKTRKNFSCFCWMVFMKM